MARARAYHDPYPLPSVNQMAVAGGQGYDAGNVYPRFKTGAQGRIQTPIIRIGAFTMVDPWHWRWGHKKC